MWRKQEIKRRKKQSSQSDIRDRLDEIHSAIATSSTDERVRFLSNESPDHNAEVFSQLGLALWEDFGLSQDFLGQISREAEVLLNESGLTSDGPLGFPSKVEIAPPGMTYRELAAAPHAIVSVRGDSSRYDAGFIDIFNFDKAIRSGEELKRTFLACSPLSDLGLGEGSRWSAANMNLYAGCCSKTRGFHVDSYGGRQIKVFVYLSDVLNLEDGPFCYSLGSHKDRSLEGINRFLAKAMEFKETDCPLVDPSSVVAVTGKAGSGFVANQSGIHRGLPQASGKRRLVLVQNFRLFD